MLKQTVVTITSTDVIIHKEWFPFKMYAKKIFRSIKWYIQRFVGLKWEIQELPKMLKYEKTLNYWEKQAVQKARDGTTQCEEERITGKKRKPYFVYNLRNGGVTIFRCKLTTREKIMLWICPKGMFERAK
jgi:hypothetical protein